MSHVFCSYSNGGTVPDVVSSVSTAIAGVVRWKTRLYIVTKNKKKMKEENYIITGRLLVNKVQRCALVTKKLQKRLTSLIRRWTVLSQGLSYPPLVHPHQPGWPSACTHRCI